MEAKLSKIRTDIDQKLQEEIRTDKIHYTNNEVKVKSDKKHELYDGEKNKNKSGNKRFFTVNGFKSKDKLLNIIEVEKTEIIYEENEKGNILDIKK